MRGARALSLALALAAVPGRARGEPAPPRPLRWSVGAGGGLLLTGAAGGGRARGDVHATVSPGGRFGRLGFTLAARHVALAPVADDALLTAGLRYEGAASRPKLALALHGDLGVTLDGRPALGGGVETHLWPARRLGPLALVFDVTAHLVLDGVDATRLVVAVATRVSLAR